MQKIATKDEGVNGRKHGMNPAGGDKQRVAGHDRHRDCCLHHISKKDLVLLGVRNPLLVELQISTGGRNQHENLFSTKNVIPDRGAAKVDVEVGI